MLSQWRSPPDATRFDPPAEAVLVVDVNVQLPGTSGVHAGLEAQPRLRAELEPPAQHEPPHLVARVRGQHVAVQVRDSADAAHPAAGSAEAGPLQLPFGVPVAGQVRQPEQLGFLCFHRL